MSDKELELINKTAKLEMEIYGDNLCSPENVLKRQKEFHNKFGLNQKTINVAFSEEILPLLISMLGMIIFLILCTQLKMETFYKYTFMTILIVVIFSLVLWIINKDCFGLGDKISLRSIKKYLKNGYVSIFSENLFKEEKENIQVSEKFLKILKEGYLSDNEIKYLKIQGDGKIKASAIYNITQSNEDFQKFKDKVSKTLN